MKSISKILKSINSAIVAGLAGIAAGSLGIKYQYLSGTNKPTFRGDQAVIIGWALVITGVWFLYFGIRKAVNNSQN